jgi:WD40 repeat protein
MVQQLAVSADGRCLAGLFGRTVLIWDPADPDRPPANLTNDLRQAFTGIAFHPSGRHLAATSNDETVKLYDPATRRLAKTFTWRVGRLRSVAFSPDGTRAAVGSDTGHVVVWDMDD